MEDQLGGDNPFEGLQPPRWDDMVQAVFGTTSAAPEDFTLSAERVRAGGALYAKHCQFCHLPPRPRLQADYAGGTFTHWTPKDPESGKRFLKVKVVELNVIGTDPNQAIDFFGRHAVTPEPKVRGRGASQYGQAWYGSDWVKAGYPGEAWSATISGATGLFQVTSFIRAKKYQELGLLVSSDLPEPERFKANNEPGLKKKRLEWDRWRSIAQALDFGDPAPILDGQDMDQLIAANLGYKARPLSGIWATPPYLHNSSVPSLYQVLLPASRRMQKFYLGRTRL